jgi:rubredoxin
MQQPVQPAWGEELMNRWQCSVCGFIYDEAEGLPDHDIDPGTLWEELPDDFVCPDCGASKDEFEMESLSD